MNTKDPEILHETHLSLSRIREILRIPADGSFARVQYRRLPRAEWMPLDMPIECGHAVCNPSEGEAPARFWDSIGSMPSVSAEGAPLLLVWRCHNPTL